MGWEKTLWECEGKVVQDLTQIVVYLELLSCEVGPRGVNPSSEIITYL